MDDFPFWAGHMVFTGKVGGTGPGGGGGGAIEIDSPATAKEGKKLILSRQIQNSPPPPPR